jgi:hypothetical protein
MKASKAGDTRKSGFQKIAKQIRASELGFPSDPDNGPRATRSLVKLKKDETTGETTVEIDPSTRADIEQAATEAAEEETKAVTQLAAPMDRKTINSMRKSQWKIKPSGSDS